MEIVKFTILNINLMEDLPLDMMNELVNLEDVIPDDLMGALYRFNKSYKRRRHDFLNYRADILQMMYEARRKRKRLAEKEYIINVHTDENVQFIREYPQFKSLINSIEYKDENRDTIKVVPIDQYLAEN
ncbi:hypothetical protein [Methanobrevibacter sp.]|uniref:hypothetical protein n=1 Tax=Methanobrevibacter sp. TaxID=66852 RepID=UPI003866A59F